MTRAEMIATFELHGWQPMSALYRRKPTRETLLCYPDDGSIIRVKRGDYRAVFNRKLAGLTNMRAAREWGQISTNRLVLMFARFDQLQRFNAAKAYVGKERG